MEGDGVVLDKKEAITLYTDKETVKCQRFFTMTDTAGQLQEGLFVMCKHEKLYVHSYAVGIHNEYHNKIHCI